MFGLFSKLSGAAIPAGITLALLPFSHTVRAEEWVTIYDKEQNGLEVQILESGNGSVKVLRKKDKKIFEIPLSRLAADSLELIKDRVSEPAGKSVKTQTATPKPLDIPADLPKSLYPRSLSEIENGLKEILAREGSGSYDAAQVEAINLLNAFRFLSGVPDDAKLDREKISEATAAANACQEHGSLSHDLGHYTDKCNLHMGGSTISDSLIGYIEDSGDNNREKRGHRAWCLNHPLKYTGFGQSADKRFYAMWSLDKGGKGARESWSYPGKGLYPLSYMHSNSWSLYLPEAAPAVEDLTVEVFELSERPDRMFRTSETPPGKSLPVSFVYSFLNVINFEPTGKTFEVPAIYFVRVTGGGLREQYLVELIDR